MKEDFAQNDPQLQSVLDALQQHGLDQRRQEAILAKINQLDAASKRRRWIGIGATVAAVGLILVLIFPLQKETMQYPSMGLVAEVNLAKEEMQPGPLEVASTTTSSISRHRSRSIVTVDTAPQTTIQSDTFTLTVEEPIQLAEADIPLEAPQATQVFIRESTRLVAKTTDAPTRKSKELPITFLAMSSAYEGDDSPNTITIKEFKL